MAKSVYRALQPHDSGRLEQVFREVPDITASAESNGIRVDSRTAIVSQTDTKLTPGRTHQTGIKYRPQFADTHKTETT
jgi:hypothetical protein